MKLFLGVSLPRAARAILREAYEQLKKDYPYYNWISEENYHVTIANLGERSDEKMPHILEAIKQSVFDVRPTSIFGLETRLFQENGIVVYLAYAKNNEFNTIRDRVIDLFNAEKENKAPNGYVPKTILATYKLPSKQQYFHVKKKLTKISFEVDFNLKEVHLFESITKSTNPEYEILHTFELVD